jgi:hypothetical protein
VGLSAIEHSVVGAPNGMDVVSSNRRHWTYAIARHDLPNIEPKLDQLVHACLHHSGGDLDRPNQRGSERSPE